MGLLNVLFGKKEIAEASCDTTDKVYEKVEDVLSSYTDILKKEIETNITKGLDEAVGEKTELLNLQDEIKNLKDETITAKEDVANAKEELAQLTSDKKIEEREIEHLVKLKEETLNLEMQKKEVTLEKEYNEKEMTLLKEGHEKLLDMIKENENKMDGFYKKILDRLPNVNMDINKDIS